MERFCKYKLSRLKKYLRKRFVRVVPAYLVVAVLWFAYHDILKGGGTWATLGYDVFALNFFLVDIWYIPATLCYYLLHERVQCFLDYHVHNPWGLLLLSVSLSIALAVGLHVLLGKVGISRPVVAKHK